jgi:hypothetical protein
MINFYEKFGIEKTSSSKKAVLTILNHVKKLPKNEPLSIDAFIALTIFLEPTLKKYYDIFMSKKKLGQKANRALHQEIESLQSISLNKLPENYVFRDSYFIQNNWLNLLARGMSLDFFFHKFTLQNDKGETEEMGYDSRRLAFFKFFLIFGFPLAMTTEDIRFIVIPIIIFVFRTVYYYGEEKVEFCHEKIKEVAKRNVSDNVETGSI